MELYIFHRGDMFYPIELRNDADARRNAVNNKGTTKVINAITKEVVWAADAVMNVQASVATDDDSKENDDKQKIKSLKEGTRRLLEKANGQTNLTFHEMITTLFNTDFLAPEELETIRTAGELYAHGKTKNLKKEIERLEEENMRLKGASGEMFSELNRLYEKHGSEQTHSVIKKYSWV